MIVFCSSSLLENAYSSRASLMHFIVLSTLRLLNAKRNLEQSKMLAGCSATPSSETRRDDVDTPLIEAPGLR